MHLAPHAEQTCTLPSVTLEKFLLAPGTCDESDSGVTLQVRGGQGEGQGDGVWVMVCVGDPAGRHRRQQVQSGVPGGLLSRGRVVEPRADMLALGSHRKGRQIDRVWKN